MTHTVIVSAASQAQAFPVGTKSTGIQFSVQGNGSAIAPITIAGAPYVATFQDVPAGDYTITAQAVDATGAAIGAPVTVQQTIAPDAPTTVSVDIPSSVSVQVQ